MTQERLKVFISAVTSEFGKARDAVASDLRARDLIVRVQSDFQQRPENETLLGTLADYLSDCHAAICIVGRYCGEIPPPLAATRFPAVLPKSISAASYTQWEFFLARRRKVRTYIYIAGDDYSPDRYAAVGDRADLQSAYVKFLKDEGIHYTKFSDSNELRIAVLRDAPDIAERPLRSAPPPTKPTVPLQPSIDYAEFSDSDDRAIGALRDARYILKRVLRAAPPTKPIVLPHPSIGELFKGRDEVMDRLRENLSRGHGRRTVIQALYGLGGIGKTRVAVEYAWAHAHEYNALLFVVAETPEALRRNLAALFKTLVPQLDTTDEAVRLAAVLDWFKANPGWFLILDSVDSGDALAEVERLLTGFVGGHVIITSRLAHFPADIQPLELDLLGVDDATAFLLERTKGRRRVAAGDEAQARAVARQLGGLALGLEQAAAFISKRRLTFAQYLEQWRSKRDEVLAWFDPTMTGYSRSVAFTWQAAVAQLSEGGRRLLERLAWLAPEKVPESLLDVPVPGAEADDLHEAYDDLASYSLVTRDAEGPFFLVHRLVQDVTRRSVAGAVKPRSLVEALGWVNAGFVGSAADVRNWPILDPLVSHARVVAAYADDADIAEPTARLMNQLGLLLKTKALHSEAEALHRRALAIGEKSFAPDHPQVAIRLNNLANLLQDTNRLAEAEPLYLRALAIDEKSFGPEHPRVATDLNNLAELLRGTNRLTEAEPLYRRALAIDEKSFGPDHPEVATDLNNLAELLRGTNRLTEAEPLYRRALAIDEKSFGPDHPDVAIDLNNLALLLKASDRLVEAEPLMRRALLIDEKRFGPHHPTVATDLNNFARLLQDTNRLADAEPLMRRAVAIFVEFARRTGHRHPHLDDAFGNYAGLLAAMGKSQAEIDAACAELMRPLAGGAGAGGENK